MMVKICGITCKDDALFCVEAGASALGFNFYTRSPRYISPERAARIAADVRNDVLKVGIFAGEPAEHIERIVRETGMDIAQVYGDAKPNMRFWRALRITKFSAEAARDAEAVLVDTPSDNVLGGTGETFDWSMARAIAGRVIVAGGLDHTNVRAAILASGAWGVDACSKLESAPGRKDPDRVRKFIQAARQV